MAYDVSLITIDHCQQLGEITLTLQALSECPNVPLQTSLNIYVTQKTQFICIKIIYIYIYMQLTLYVYVEPQKW